MTTTTREYRTVSLSRPNGDYVEIQSVGTKVYRVYEYYKGIGGHEIRGYEGAHIENVVDQFISWGWVRD